MWKWSNSKKRETVAAAFSGCLGDGVGGGEVDVVEVRVAAIEACGVSGDLRASGSK
jgi:hypothetical protein